jgi:hypothetical protein
VNRRAKASQGVGIRLRPLYWVGLAAVVLLLDLMTGPLLQFPVLFVLPVLLSSWFSGARWGVGLAVCQPIARLSLFWPWGLAHPVPIELANAAVRILVLAILAVLTARAARTRSLEAHIRALEAIIPICSFCKKMREEDGSWVPLERYIGERSATRFSHGVCPECALQHYGLSTKG